MRVKQLLTIVVVSTLLVGGMAALGAASPADQAPSTATDAVEENAPQNETSDADKERADTSNERADDATERDGNPESVGPSDGLPKQVPDHVSGIHETIESFLNGSIDNLGESLSGLISDGKTADETPDENDDSDEDASEAT